MTPISSFGVSAAMIAPVLTNIRCRVGDEGVEALVDDEEDLDVAGLDAGLGEDRRRVVLEERLGLGVAGDVDPRGQRRLGGEGSGHERRGERAAALSARPRGPFHPADGLLGTVTGHTRPNCSISASSAASQSGLAIGRSRVP